MTSIPMWELLVYRGNDDTPRTRMFFLDFFVMSEFVSAQLGNNDLFSENGSECLYYLSCKDELYCEIYKREVFE